VFLFRVIVNFHQCGALVTELTEVDDNPNPPRLTRTFRIDMKIRVVPAALRIPCVETVRRTQKGANVFASFSPEILDFLF
jgi:hypothetical protein